MLRDLIRQAAGDRPVYLPDVREMFQAEGTRPFHIHLTLCDRSVRVFPLMLPRAEGQEETAFVTAYVHASIYNLLSTLGALRLEIYLDRRDRPLTELAEELNAVFQLHWARADRRGYGKCLNVNERVLDALFHGKERFAFRICDIGDEPAVPETAAVSSGRAPVFARLPDLTQGRLLLGMDVGGTDVKLAVSMDGRLVLCGEYDWSPADFTCAEQLLDPLLLLARLARAAGSLWAAGRGQEAEPPLWDRRAAPEQLARAAQALERAAGDCLRSFDAIGLCFPDVVIQNRVVGGETPKTRGMRSSDRLGYEAQFAKISGLNQALAAYAVPGGPVLCINDGPMAAFTAAVEQAAGGADMSQGFFAHSLGTDLGTGWVRPDGTIPDLPMEVYNCIIDLGSFAQRRFDSGDARSIRNFSTALPGTPQRYVGQSGVFRLAALRLPREAPAVFQEALDRGLFRWEGERLVVPTRPEDMRKACLEFFMDRAARPGPEAEIFREIGGCLAVVWRETDYMLRPETRTRSLFGRLVKQPACFRLLQEGAARREPELRLLAADGSLANTPLMRQLQDHPDFTVAQFAQAVGAVYYGCLGLLREEGGPAVEEVCH